MRILPAIQVVNSRVLLTALNAVVLLCSSMLLTYPNIASAQEADIDPPPKQQEPEIAGDEKKADTQKADTKKAVPKKPADEKTTPKKADEKKVEEKKPDENAADEDKVEPAPQKKQVKKPVPKPNQKPNPIQNIFNNLFPGRKPVAKPGAAVDGPAAAKKSTDITLDAIDRRAPVDRAQNTILERAQRAAEIGNWTQVIGHLDRLFQRDQDSLVLKGDGTMVSIRQEAIRILGSMPEEQRELYVRQYSGAAERLLSEAAAENDMSKLVEVATRYFWTESGVAAANLLGTRHLDKGEYGMASIWLKQLLDADAEITKNKAWQTKAYFVFKMAGKSDMVATIAKRFSEPTLESELLSGSVASRKPVELDEWLYLFGNVKRHSVSAGSEPVLLKRWELPTTWNQPLVKKIDQLITEFTDRGISTIPVGMPLLVDGFLVARTFQGVQVADAKTGREIWATEFNKSIEGTLTGANSNPQFAMFNQNPQFFIGNSNSSDNSGGPMGRIMFQNAANSLLSSDGKRVYIVDDTTLFTMGQSNVFGFNSRSNKNLFASNRLKAYDLKTGRPIWEAGGDDSIEELALPLRGCFFLGAPVPDGDDLLVVAEKDGEIRLHVLEPSTGHPKWSQLLAYADQRINKDFARRIWSTQVSVAGGTIICPTSVGWLVAVDRTRRSVLWAFRYSERKSQTARAKRVFRSSYMSIRNEALNSRWATSAPIIVGDQILYTPPEKATDGTNQYTSTSSLQSGTLACVDLYSGKRVWQKPRGTALYIAGVLHDNLIIVNPDNVEAITVEKKKSVWKSKFEPTDGKPSGRGVILNGHFYQPTQQNKLLKIDLSNGKIVSRLELGDDERPLGNLTMYDGMVLSFHPAAISAFEQQHAIDEKLAKIRAGASDDESIVFESEVALAQGDFQKTIGLVLPLYKTKIDSRIRQAQVRIETTLRRAVAAQLRYSPGDQPELITLLEELARTPKHQLENRQLRVGALIAADKYMEAFSTLVEFGQQQQFLKVVRLDQPKVETDFDNWLAGRLKDVWSRLDKEQRAEQGESISEQVAAMIKADDIELQMRYARLFDFHVEASNLFEKLYQHSIDSKNTAAAIYWLQKLQARSTPEERDELAKKELKLAIDSKDWIASAQILERATNSLKDKTALAEQRKQIAALQPKPRPDWGDFDLNMKRSSSNYSYRPAKILEDKTGDSSILSDLRMEYGRQGYSTSSTSRINFVRESDNSLYWSVPIRVGKTTRSIFDIQLNDRLVIVLNRGIINCLSVPDRKVMWTRNVGDSDLNVATTSFQSQAMQLGSAFMTYSSHQQKHLSGAIPVFNNEITCFRGRREVVCLDTRTGKLRWACDRIIPGSKVFASRSTVFIVPPNADDAFALRASDGRELKSHSSVSLFDRNVIDNSEDHVVRCTRKGTGSDAKITLISIGLESKRIGWKHDFPSRCYFRKISNREIGMIDSDGLVSTLNLETGKITTFDTIPATKRAGTTQRFLIPGKDHMFAVLNSGGSSYTSSGDMPYLRATGKLAAFDKKTGKMLWIKPVDKMNLMLSQVTRSPVLLFTRQVYDSKISSQKVDLLVLDKKTGRQLITATTYTYSSFRNMHVDLNGKFIDIATYNERLRFEAIARRPEAAKQTAPKTKADNAKAKAENPKVKADGPKAKVADPKIKAVAPKAKVVKATAKLTVK
jgi:outer membrane protein assembly factor BamB